MTLRHTNKPTAWEVVDSDLELPVTLLTAIRWDSERIKELEAATNVMVVELTAFRGALNRRDARIRELAAERASWRQMDIDAVVSRNARIRELEAEIERLREALASEERARDRVLGILEGNGDG